MELYFLSAFHFIPREDHPPLYYFYFTISMDSNGILERTADLINGPWVVVPGTTGLIRPAPLPSEFSGSRAETKLS